MTGEATDTYPRIELLNGLYYIIDEGTDREQLLSTYKWKGYAHKSSAKRALKRHNEREPHYVCQLCGDSATEIRSGGRCPIESINCYSHQNFPNRYREGYEGAMKVQTANDIVGVGETGLFQVKTTHYIVGQGGIQAPVTPAEIRVYKHATKGA